MNRPLQFHSKHHDSLQHDASLKVAQQESFEFKSYAVVRALVYQAHAVKNQYLIQHLVRMKEKEAEQQQNISHKSK